MKFRAHKRLFRALGTRQLAIKLEGTQVLTEWLVLNSRLI